MNIKGQLCCRHRDLILCSEQVLLVICKNMKKKKTSTLLIFQFWWNFPGVIGCQTLPLLRCLPLWRKENALLSCPLGHAISYFCLPLMHCSWNKYFCTRLWGSAGENIFFYFAYMYMTADVYTFISTVYYLTQKCIPCLGMFYDGAVKS